MTDARAAQPEADTSSWPPSDVPMAIRVEIDHWLRHPDNTTQLAAVARLEAAGITDRNEIVAAGGAANYSAVANKQVAIRIIRDGVIPTKPSYGTANASAARSFLKTFRAQMSRQVQDHLANVIDSCEAVAGNRVAIEAENDELEQGSEALEQELAARGGVYVYSYPHYLRFPTVDGTERTLLKIGKSDRAAHIRINEQGRMTAAPEKPVVLRVYHSETKSPAEMERQFHRLLAAADHDSSRGGAREWYETSLVMLDTVADILGFETSHRDPG